MADGSIHIASQTWPSGSARLRLYMKPRSCLGLMSPVPPCAAAAAFIASTASRLSSDIASSTSLEVDGGIGRLVNVRHLSWVSSITLIASLQTRSEEHQS